MSSGQWMVVLIVLIVTVGRIARTRFQAQHGIIEDRHGRVQMLSQPQEEATKAEMQRELETLRERVKVLERIATDINSTEQRRSRSIADEIEALRDN